MSTFVPNDWPCPIGWREVEEAFETTCGINGFWQAKLAGNDIQVVSEAWDQGIDSRLEAITAPSSASMFRDLFVTKLKVNLDLRGFLVLLRRLYEMWALDGDADAFSIYEEALASIGMELEG